MRTSSLLHFLIHLFIQAFIPSLIPLLSLFYTFLFSLSFMFSLPHPSSYFFTPSFTSSHLHPFSHSFIHSFFCSFTLSLFHLKTIPLASSLTPLLTPTITFNLTHSLISFHIFSCFLKFITGGKQLGLTRNKHTQTQPTKTLHNSFYLSNSWEKAMHIPYCIHTVSFSCHAKILAFSVLHYLTLHICKNFIVVKI